MKILLIILLSACSSRAVNPLRPSSPVGGTSRPVDCSGMIGFSAKGLGRVHSSGLAGYKTKLVNPGGGFYPETGEYTVDCPGFYFVSFASYPEKPSMLTLKMHRARSSNWEDLVSTGPNGGSNQIILQLQSGDQIGVFFSGSPVESKDSSTFSAYRLTQK